MPAAAATERRRSPPFSCWCASTFPQDWISDKFGAVLEIEAGWHITRHWNTWIKPGVGTNGSRAAGVYDELLQVGARYVF